MAQRQEVLNVLLAQVLAERGVIAAPEQILAEPSSQATRLPDVIVDFNGLRLAIEAEIGNDEGSKAAAFNKAQERVYEGLAHIGVAVAYPTSLRETAFARAKDELETTRMDFCVLTEVNLPETQRLLFGSEEPPVFMTGTVQDLAEAIRRSYEGLVADTTLQCAVERIGTSIGVFLAAMNAQPASPRRLARTLGMAQEFEQLNVRQLQAVARISALIVLNAMMFQEVLSKADARVRPLRVFLEVNDCHTVLADHWRFILAEINYFPIFNTAHQLLQDLSADIDVGNALRELLNTALEIVDWRAALRHDLAGRIYHRLLEEAKYLGAYYTSIPAAVLLLKLALPAGNCTWDWCADERLRQLRIADLACGTGTLLLAAADVILDNYVRSCVAHRLQPNLVEFQHTIVEHVLHGYDVLPSALHLTASTLSLRMPEAPVNVTHLYLMPHGGPGHPMGTLEFLEHQALPGMLYGEPQRVTGTGMREVEVPPIPPLDLCVMNPPFTRSVGGNLLFGSLPASERRRMQTKLQNAVKRTGIPASITAGLGSVFVALGDRHIRNTGRIALVLPRALVSGVAWKPTRNLLTTRYDLEYMIVSHEPDHWNFSENTQLSEVLLVARKRPSNNNNHAPRTVPLTAVNLWKQPRNAIEALSVARSIAAASRQGSAPNTASEIKLGHMKVGEAIVIDSQAVDTDSLKFSCAFAQPDLVWALIEARSGRLCLPGIISSRSLPLCLLQELGELGFDARDIHDAFTISGSVTPYAALWNHDASAVTTMSQRPNCWLRPRSEPKKGRPARDADHLWQRSGTLLLSGELRLNTMCVSAALLSRKVVSNVWWSIRLSTKSKHDEKCLALWLNSSLGLLLLLGHRIETCGAWVHFKKPVLLSMPVLDVRQLTARKKERLARAFDELARRPLEPFPNMTEDETRIRIDAAISAALGLPDLSVLREMLAREPIVCLTLDRLGIR